MHAPEKTLGRGRSQRADSTDRKLPNPDPESAEQIAVLAQNARDFGIQYYNEFDKRQGIVHIIGPEQGFTLPGTTIVCGDSHTATHGAFGALAYGIGTSEVEHVLATQTLIQTKSKNMRAVVDGQLPPGVTSKDIILAIIGEIGTAGGTGYALEYAGEAIRSLSMEGRMTICNMSVEGGAKAGLMAPDEKIYAYLEGPAEGAQGRRLGSARMRYWETLQSDDGAHFDSEIRLDARQAAADGHLGHQPRTDVVSISGQVPDRVRNRRRERSASPPSARSAIWACSGGEKITDIKLDRVFIGSCTNGRIEDLRAVAKIAAGHTVNANVKAMIVPGSGLVKEQAEAEGLDKIFKAAGFEWREPGLLDVPCDESGQARTGRALRLDLEPQLRRPSGLQGPHPSGVAGHGGSGGDRRPLRRCARVEVSLQRRVERNESRSTIAGLVIALLHPSSDEENHRTHHYHKPAARRIWLRAQRLDRARPSATAPPLWPGPWRISAMSRSTPSTSSSAAITTYCSSRIPAYRARRPARRAEHRQERVRLLDARFGLCADA